MKSNSSNGQLTAQINVKDQQKSGFDLSQNVLGTGKIGRIIPTRALHVMPGDTINQDSKVAVQFEPLAVPILANMDVKQEHFYVPYNVVWKNWDKFISGGEKMDYVGVVPNVSISRMFNLILSKLGYTIDLGTVGDYGSHIVMLYSEYILRYFYEEREVYDYLDEYSRYAALAGTAQTKDIQSQVLAGMQEFYLALHNYIKIWLDGYAENNNGVIDYRNGLDMYYRIADKDQLDRYLAWGLDPTVTDADIAEYNIEPFNDLLNNKYIKEIYPALVEWLETGSIYMPELDFLSVIESLYEVFKPLVGYGSNIDYLNMGRVTKAEFIFSVIAGMSKYIQNLDDTEGETKLFEFGSFSNLPLSVLNLRANYSVWYNNYRDILLETKALEPVIEDEITDDELFNLLLPRQRCWEKDMFTTALDTPGTGMVGVPVGVQDGSFGFPFESFYQTGIFSLNDSIGDSVDIDQNSVYEVSVGDKTWRVPTSFLTGINKKDDQTGEVSGGFSLYQLEAAQRAQKWLQKALYFGNRISDFYYLRFGVRFLDARLRLPELLSSSSELVKLDVLVNNTTTSESIAGDRAAYASAYDNGNSFKRYCEEHGVLLSYLTIMPQVTYAHGINRDYSRLDQFDYAFSEFATLGMDAVYDTEITASSVVVQPTGTDNVKPYVFGYQGKYYDYKAKHSEEHGELLDSQDMYTFSRKFNMFDPNGRPKLNYEFVHCFPALDMFVVDSPLADYFRYDIRHSTAAERGLPSQSIYI